MHSKPQGTPSALDAISDEMVDLMIVQNGEMALIEIGRAVGLTNTRVIQILEGTQAKFRTGMLLRGYDNDNLKDLFLDGMQDRALRR